MIQSSREAKVAASWERQFAELMEFRRTHGHFNVPTHGTTSSLCVWVRIQRQLHRLEQLPPDHQRRLEEIGFPWINASSPVEQVWDRNFARLVEFHRVNGHFDVKHAAGVGGGLNVWIRTQRLLQAFGNLRPDRRQRLETAGFPWNPPLNPD